MCYYSSEKSYNARILTALTNRLGDVAILLTISFNRGVGLFNFTNFRVSNSGMVVGSIVLILAAITKRAQIPFSA